MTDDQNAKPSGQSEEINMADPNPRTPSPRKAAISPTRQADGPSWTRCRDNCVQPRGRQAHCTVCHATFTTVANFDKHRRNGHCTDPATLGMTANDRGVWRIPMPEDVRERMEWAR